MEIHYSRSFLKYIHSIYTYMFIYIYKTCKWSYPIQNDNVSLDVIGYFECDNAEEIIFSGPRSSL